MGDNGFMFGEHGLIDKRAAYEESMRVPLVARCPSLFPAGRSIEQVVANIDIAPTMLAAAGLVPPPHMAGSDMLPLSAGWYDHSLSSRSMCRPRGCALETPQPPRESAAAIAFRFRIIRITTSWSRPIHVAALPHMGHAATARVAARGGKA